MALRKAHSKSRRGCLPCKKRHIKCGEQHPSCSNCQKSRKECIYPPLAPSRSGSVESPSQVASIAKTSPGYTESSHEAEGSLTPSHGQDPTRVPPTITPRLQELRLMIQFTTSSYESLAHNPGDAEVWRKFIPEEAAFHDFLMDGLLAFSALHFASQHPNLQWQYCEIAVQYQGAGLQKYKYAMERINSDNSAALFAFAMIINVLALAFPNVYPGSTHSSHADGLMSMLNLVRGVGLMSQINNTTGATRRQQDFAPLYQSFYQDWGDIALPENIKCMFQTLRERADSVTGLSNADRQRAYNMGIENLEEAFKRTDATRNTGHAIAWPVMMGDFELYKLFKAGDPMAQFIFLHYGVLLLYVRDRWWGKDTGASLVEHLAKCLHDTDPEWSTWTQQARSIANSDFGRHSACDAE